MINRKVLTALGVSSGLGSVVIVVELSLRRLTSVGKQCLPSSLTVELLILCLSTTHHLTFGVNS